MYEHPEVDEALSQGDIIGDCPIVFLESSASPEGVDWEPRTLNVRVIVLTQACDLAQKKASRVLVALVHTAQSLVDQGVLKGTTIREQVRNHRVYGWYFLPTGPRSPEPIVDLRDLHTVPRAILEWLIQKGERICRVATPYREHLAQHFSVTYSRIGLPEPYPTQD
jgi:hypothetical protein